jgi:membrane-associated phospholipid phosphatase
MDRAEREGELKPAPEARARFGIHGILAFIAVFVAAVPFGIIVLLLREKAAWLRHVDRDTAVDLHGYDERHRGFVTAMRFISNSGSSLAWIVVLTLVGLWLLYRHLYRLTAFLAVTAIGSSLLNEAIKAAVGRTRPVLVNPVATATGKSFPSGHTQSAIVGYGILVLIFLPVVARRWRVTLVAVAALMVLLIGFSRIALGVHYLSDVVGGLVIGSAWLLAMTAAFSAWRQDRNLPPVHPTEGLEPEQAEQLSPDT